MYNYNAVGGPGDCKMILKSNDTLELLYIHVYTYEKLNKPRTQLHKAMDQYKLKRLCKH